MSASKPYALAPYGRRNPSLPMFGILHPDHDDPMTKSEWIESELVRRGFYSKTTVKQFWDHGGRLDIDNNVIVYSRKSCKGKGKCLRKGKCVGKCGVFPRVPEGKGQGNGNASSSGNGKGGKGRFIIGVQKKSKFMKRMQWESHINQQYSDVPDDYAKCHTKEMRRRWYELRLSAKFIATFFGQL